jgi:hypothetical protein
MGHNSEVTRLALETQYSQSEPISKNKRGAEQMKTFDRKQGSQKKPFD